MARYDTMDIVELDGVAELEGATVKNIFVKSKRTGRKYNKPLVVPSEVEINANTEIQLMSSTNEYNNLDRIDIVQKEDDKPARVFLRSENGTYKEKLPDPDKKTNTPVYTASEKTYNL